MTPGAWLICGIVCIPAAYAIWLHAHDVWALQRDVASLKRWRAETFGGPLPQALAGEPDTDEIPTVIAHPASSEARKAELLRPVPYRRDDEPWRQQFRFSENGRRHG